MHVLQKESIWVVVKVMLPFGGALNIRCRITIGIEKGTIILATSHMNLTFSGIGVYACVFCMGITTRVVLAKCVN